jgi:hypothetical protein
MAARWGVSAWLLTEKRFRRIDGRQVYLAGDE